MPKKTRPLTEAARRDPITQAVAVPLWAAFGLAVVLAFAQPDARAQGAPAAATPTAQPSPQVSAANRQAETAFLRADTNGDGKLSRDEAERLPAIAARFDEIDTNHDQFLSLAEFNKVGAK